MLRPLLANTNFKRLSAFAVCLLFTFPLLAQRVAIAQRSTAGGEGCWPYVSDSVTSTSGSFGFPNVNPRWIPVGGTPAPLCPACPASQRHTSTYDGERYEIQSQTSTINFATINIAAYKQVSLSLRYGNSEGGRSGQRTNGPGWDATDEVNLLPSAGVVATDFTPGGGNTAVYDELLTHNVPDGTQAFGFGVRIRVNRVDEIVLLRNIVLSAPQVLGGFALGRDITASSTSACPGGSITLSADGSLAARGWTFQWQFNGANLPGETNATLSLSALTQAQVGAYRVLYIPTAPSQGCILPTAASEAINISLSVGQPPVVTAPTNVLCPGAVTTLRTGFIGTAYRWFRGTTEITGIITDSLVVSGAGDYSVEVTTPTCVVTSLPFSVSAGTQPTLAVTALQPAVCPGFGTRLTATGGVTYSWAPAVGLSNSTGDTVFARPDTSTTYTIIGANANGCVDTISIRVVVNPKPIVTTTNLDTTTCSGNAIVLAVNGADTYEWSPSAGLNTTSGNTVIANPNQDTPYRIIGTNATGCKDTITINVRINILPTANAGLPQRLCLGNSIQLGATGLPGFNYAWRQVGGVSDTTLAQPTFRPMSHGVYRLPLLVRSITTGCFATDTVTITVDSLPSFVATATGTTICQGESLPLATFNARSYTYNWQPASNLSGAGVSNPVFTYPTRLTRDSLFTYVLSATTGQSCTATDTVRILVLARPDARTATGATICLNSQTNIGFTGAPSPSSIRFQWTGAAAAALSNDTVASPVFNAAMLPGIGTISRDTTLRLLVSLTRRGTSCQDTQSVLVTVRPVPVSVTGPDINLCEGQVGTLGIVRPGYGRSWSIIDGQGTLDNMIAEQPRYQAPAIVSVDTTVLVGLVTTDILTGCQRLDTVRISVIQLPRMRPQPTDVAPLLICAGEAGSLTASPESPISILTYQWLQGSMVVANGPILNLTNTNTGTTATTERYTLVTNRLNGGCEVRQEAVVRLLAPVTTSLAHNNNWLCPEQLTGKVYSARPALPGQSYAWQLTGGDIIRQDSNAVVVNWQEGAGRYEVAVTTTSGEGCRTTLARLEVQLDATVSDPNSGCNLDHYPLMVPNVITPNGDGVNDEFGIKNLAFYPNLSLQVFNRFGVQVYKADNYRNNWNADGLPAGTYFIVLNTGRGKTVKGFVEVVK